MGESPVCTAGLQEMPSHHLHPPQTRFLGRPFHRPSGEGVSNTGRCGELKLGGGGIFRSSLWVPWTRPRFPSYKGSSILDSVKCSVEPWLTVLNLRVILFWLSGCLFGALLIFSLDFRGLAQWPSEKPD